MCCSFSAFTVLRGGGGAGEDGGIFMRHFLDNINVSSLSSRSRAMLRLSAVQRDFTGDDYAMLQALDDGVDMPFKGATQREINRLPTQLMTENDAKIALQRKDYCAVCLEPYAAGDEVKTLQCLHRYHNKCIDVWLAEKASCPVCKFEYVV
jgi:hypothetical protein